MPCIEAFRVPPEDDEAFLAAVRRGRHPGATALHRALREDTALRWVAVTRLDTSQPAAAAAGELPRATGAQAWRVHAGAYEVVHDEGAVDAAGGAVLIAGWDVPEAGDERFAAAWERVRAAEAAQGGCLGIRLHRGAGLARLRWVQLTRWSSPLMVHRARGRAEVRTATEGLVPPAAHAALYLVVSPGAS